MHSKAFFATILLSHAAKSLDSLGNKPWGAWGARGPNKLRARRLGIHHPQEAKGHKAWNLPRTIKEPLIRSSGKSLAQGQVALIDPT